MGGRTRTVSNDPPEGFATWRAFLEARLAAGDSRASAQAAAIAAGCAPENARKRLSEILGPVLGRPLERRPPAPHQTWKEMARALARRGDGLEAARAEMMAAGCAEPTANQSLRDAYPPAREEMRRPEPLTDTRCLTGRLFGDPMPGRSALDQRRGA